MTIIAHGFPEISAPKNMIRYISKKPFLKEPLETEQGKCVETL